jgi:predicted RNA-binding protein with RPS1 domain
MTNPNPTTARVAIITHAGVWLDLGTRRHAFLHVSRLRPLAGGQFVAHPAHVLKTGQTVAVVVTGTDPSGRPLVDLAPTHHSPQDAAQPPDPSAAKPLYPGGIPPNQADGEPGCKGQSLRGPQPTLRNPSAHNHKA